MIRHTVGVAAGLLIGCLVGAAMVLVALHDSVGRHPARTRLVPVREW